MSEARSLERLREKLKPSPIEAKPSLPEDVAFSGRVMSGAVGECRQATIRGGGWGGTPGGSGGPTGERGLRRMRLIGLTG